MFPSQGWYPPQRNCLPEGIRCDARLDGFHQRYQNPSQGPCLPHDGSTGQNYHQIVQTASGLTSSGQASEFIQPNMQAHNYGSVKQFGPRQDSAGNQYAQRHGPPSYPQYCVQQQYPLGHQYFPKQLESTRQDVSRPPYPSIRHILQQQYLPQNLPSQYPHHTFAKPPGQTSQGQLQQTLSNSNQLCTGKDALMRQKFSGQSMTSCQSAGISGGFEQTPATVSSSSVFPQGVPVERNKFLSLCKQNKRVFPDVPSPGPQPVKKVCDEFSTPYSVKLNGYQKGMHIQGSCFLTVTPESSCQQNKPSSFADKRGLLGSSEGVRSSSANANSSGCVEGHLDVSVTPVVLPQKMNEKACLADASCAQKIMWSVVSVACKHIPFVRNYLRKLKQTNELMCISDKICVTLLTRVANLSSDCRNILNFYRKHRTTLCHLVYQGQCKQCKFSSVSPVGSLCNTGSESDISRIEDISKTLDDKTGHSDGFLSESFAQEKSAWDEPDALRVRNDQQVPRPNCSLTTPDRSTGNMSTTNTPCSQFGRLAWDVTNTGKPQQFGNRFEGSTDLFQQDVDVDDRQSTFLSESEFRERPFNGRIPNSLEKTEKENLDANRTAENDGLDCFKVMCPVVKPTSEINWKRKELNINQCGSNWHSPVSAATETSLRLQTRKVSESNEQFDALVKRNTPSLPNSVFLPPVMSPGELYGSRLQSGLNYEQTCANANETKQSYKSETQSTLAPNKLKGKPVSVEGPTSVTSSGTEIASITALTQLEKLSDPVTAEGVSLNHQRNIFSDFIPEALAVPKSTAIDKTTSNLTGENADVTTSKASLCSSSSVVEAAEKDMLGSGRSKPVEFSLGSEFKANGKTTTLSSAKTSEYTKGTYSARLSEGGDNADSHPPKHTNQMVDSKDDSGQKITGNQPSLFSTPSNSVIFIPDDNDDDEITTVEFDMDEWEALMRG